MRTLEATQAFEPLLSELAKGEPIEIRRGNMPVALLIELPSPQRRERIRQAVDQLKEIRKGLTLGGLNPKDLINEGRRM